MQLADLALGQRDDADPGERQALVERRHILLIARQAVEGRGDDDIELAIAGVGEQALIAGPQG
jgi:hypothetical protein